MSSNFVEAPANKRDSSFNSSAEPIASHARYQYRKLQKSSSTRLLKVGRWISGFTQGNDDRSAVRSQPTYEIIEIDLYDRNRPEYETVSYAWGDSAKDAPVWLSKNEVLYAT